MNGTSAPTLLAAVLVVTAAGSPALAAVLDLDDEPATPERAAWPASWIGVNGDHPVGGFTLGEDPATGEPIYRPGTGVTGGTGTPEDPYVIENWCIIPAGAHYGMWIQNTDAHLLIRDNLIHGVHHQGTAILLDNADNVTVANNTITAHTGAAITAMATSEHVTITGNSIRDNYRGLHILSGSANPTIVNNTITDSQDLGMLYGVANGLVANNTITDSGDDGIVLLRDADGTRLEHNRIAGTGDDGIRMYRAGGARIVHNDIVDNAGAALRVTNGTTTVDASGNWWGAASGPSGGLADACTGEVADGEGGAIAVEDDSDLCFDPWLKGPFGGP